MSFKYEYNKKINSSALTIEIENSDMTAVIDIMGISTHGDDFEIHFETELSTAEKSLLDTIITDHVFVPPERESIASNIVLNIRESGTGPTWISVADFIFRGTDHSTPIVLKIIAKESGRIRLIRTDNGQVLASISDISGSDLKYL